MPSSANATELYVAMYQAILDTTWPRQCSDPESVQLAPTIEARPGCEFELRFPEYNIQIAVPFNLQWAIANTLHFFTASEEAEMLQNYNKQAARFIVNGKWIGAYGAIAIPQIQECIIRLRQHPQSRRAIVSMGAASPQDLHRPACWSFLQFLLCRDKLYLLVYQRSLNLAKVMPYDLIVLSNILIHVAKAIEQPVGPLIWTVGSLHMLELQTPNYNGARHLSLITPTDPTTCLNALLYPKLHEKVWAL